MVQPVHFEDFSGQQFERLVFAHHLRAESWRSLEWYGQIGSDLGRDIWGQRQTGETVCIQCVNRKTTGATKIIRDMDKIARAPGGIPDVFLVVCASNVTAKLRDTVKNHAANVGFSQCEIWSGQEFEERLRLDSESLLMRFLQGEAFPDTPEELRQFTSLKAGHDHAAIALIIQIFDRPAFTTPFQQESSLRAFRQAIVDTINALNTGIWQTRDGKEIERVPRRHLFGNEVVRNELAVIVHDLVELRAQFDQLIRDGEIRSCGCMQPECPVFFLSPTAIHRMDSLRSKILSRVHGLAHCHEISARPQQAVTVIGATNTGIIANQVTVRGSRPRQQVIILPNSIGSDPRRYNYVEYLIKRLTEFREAGASYGQNRTGRVHPGATRKILEKQLGGLPKDLPADRFGEIVAHLQGKIDDTAVGRRNRRGNVANYHSFEEHGGPN